MPDDDTGTEQAVEEETAADAVEATAEETAAGEEQWEPERAMATIHKQREEVKALKAQLREKAQIEKRLKELEDAKLSEEEKQAQRLTELEAEQAEWVAERQELRLQQAVLTLAPKLGIADPEITLALLDRATLEHDDTGTPTNLEAQLVALLDRKPILKQTAAPSSTDGGAGRQPAQAAKLTAEELEWAQKTGMPAERYEQFKGVTTIEDFEKLKAREQTAQAAAQ